MNITQVVIPAAGFGSRFLPITKTIPKEMLPLLNKPALQYTIEEASAAGISHCCIIINKEKEAIRHYFSPSKKPEQEGEDSKKKSLLSGLNSLIDATTFTYLDQPVMRGLGDAIVMAKQAVGNNFFGVMLPDDIIFHSDPGIGQLIKIAQQMQTSVIAVVEVPPSEISAYGCIQVGKKLNDDLFEVANIIEKPKPHEAFSNLAIIGRYVFSPAIFGAIEAITPQARGEIQLTDAMIHLVHNGQRVLAYKIKGNRFDLGRPQGWLSANVFLANQAKAA